MTVNKQLGVLWMVITVVFIMVVTKKYLLPIILAFLIWYVIHELRLFLNKNKFIRKNTPIWLQNAMVFFLLFLFLGLMSELLSKNIEDFLTKMPHYEQNIQLLNSQIEDKYDLDVLIMIQKNIGEIKFADLVQPVINGLTSFLGDGFMILLYCIFMVLEETVFQHKYDKLFSSTAQKEGFNKILERINSSFSQYFSLKTIISIITGVGSYIILALFQVDSPVLWSILIFLLNYIPSIGSLIATAFPTLVCMLQHASLFPAIYVLICVGILQVIVGNVLEPKMMGGSLNISPFVVIVGLTIFGAIWGIIGMVLSVPIIIMLIIIFAQFDSTKNVAILLSENGNI